MEKQLLVILSLILLTNAGKAQDPKQMISRISDVKATISIASDGYISKEKLSKGFTLILSDTTYKVLSFQFTYWCNSDMCTLRNQGPKFDTSHHHFQRTFESIPLNSLVFVDDIKIEKSGKLFKPESFILTVTH